MDSAQLYCPFDKCRSALSPRTLAFPMLALKSMSDDMTFGSTCTPIDVRGEVEHDGNGHDVQVHFAPCPLDFSARGISTRGT
jgi:hypothetical protein